MTTVLNANALSAEPPSIIEASPSVVKAAFGQSVNLSCRAFGAPTPVIVWSRGEARSRLGQSWSHVHVADNESDVAQHARFTVSDFGTLTIHVSIRMCHILSVSNESSLELNLNASSMQYFIWF